MRRDEVESDCEGANNEAAASPLKRRCINERTALSFARVGRCFKGPWRGIAPLDWRHQPFRRSSAKFLIV